MKISLNVEADSVSAMALNMGRIVVEIDGIVLTELIDAVNCNGYSLCIGSEPRAIIVGTSELSRDEHL